MENNKIKIDDDKLIHFLYNYFNKQENKEERRKLKKLQKYIMDELAELWSEHYLSERKNNKEKMNDFKQLIKIKENELRVTNHKLFGSILPTL